MSNNTNSENTDAYNPYDAFSSRRKLYLSLEKAQQLEHETLNDLSATVSAYKETLLNYLSYWLLSKETSSDYREIEAITGISMANWTELQKQARILASEQRESAGKLSSAKSSLQIVRPSPIISKMMASETEKAEIILKESQYDACQASLSRIDAQINENDNKRCDFGGRFLRACLAHVPELESSNAFGIEVARLSADVTAAIGRKWQAYEVQVRTHLSDVAVNTNYLYQIYGLKE